MSNVHYVLTQITLVIVCSDVFATQAQAVKKDERYATKLYSNDFKHFTTSCLTTDRLIRPYVQQLKKHKFMKSFLNMGQLNLIQALDLKESIHFKSSPGKKMGNADNYAIALLPTVINNFFYFQV